MGLLFFFSRYSDDEGENDVFCTKRKGSLEGAFEDLFLCITDGKDSSHIG